MKEKDALYAKPDFTDEDGERAAELEARVCRDERLGRRDRGGRSCCSGLGMPTELHDGQMATLDGRQKVKVLLAQALFGQPDIILLDEPTNDLDVESHRNGWRTSSWTATRIGDRGQPRPPLPQRRLHPHRGHRLRHRSRCTWATTTSGTSPAS